MKKVKFAYLTAISRILWKKPTLMEAANSFVNGEKQHRLWSGQTSDNCRALLKHYKDYGKDFSKHFNEKLRRGEFPSAEPCFLL